MLALFLVAAFLLFGTPSKAVENTPNNAAPPVYKEIGKLSESTYNLDQLNRHIESYINQSRFNGSTWGIKIISLDKNKTIYEHNPNIRLSPASNSKLYTAALALTILSSAYRIKTPILSTASVDSKGLINGDIIVSGRGDPSWNFRSLNCDFWDVFDPFIRLLKEKNITHISGNIIADSTWLKEPPQGSSWTVDDMENAFGAELSGITLADNYINLRITPSLKAGNQCTIELLQPLSGLSIDNHTITGEKNTNRVLRVERFPGEHILRIFGTLPLNGEPELTDAPVPEPSYWFARCLKQALLNAGIKVDGDAVSVRWPDSGLNSANVLGYITSPVLRELVKNCLKPSQNLETDLIFAQLGELMRTPTTSNWLRSDELAVQALDHYLLSIVTPKDAVFFDEGSGLSRNNLTTAAATVNLLKAMALHPEYTSFYDALPIAGVDGSLAKRMLGTSAAGNVHAKTGGLRWVSSLSGYINSASGEKIAFSFMLNRHVASKEFRSTDDLDNLCLMLARYQGNR
jgi:D-alanyl-D-alanine carboxypeptidase/D-alanyl-D-alanine-endopeptidase (penicillin-binding protein 4)